MSNKPKQIIYLAQKYSGREAVSLAEALDYKWKLEAAGYTADKGYVVYSPVIDTALEDWCKNPNFISALHNIFEGLNPDDKFDPTLVVFMNFIRSMTKVKANIMPLDYVQYDLGLLQEWLKHDWEVSNDNHKCNKNNFAECGYSYELSHYDCNVSKYDSGLLMSFCPSCFDDEYISSQQVKDGCLGLESYWNSKGAKAEYDFAKKNYVECVLADSLYSGERERI